MKKGALGERVKCCCGSLSAVRTSEGPLESIILRHFVAVYGGLGPEITAEQLAQVDSAHKLVFTDLSGQLTILGDDYNLYGYVCLITGQADIPGALAEARRAK